MNSFFSASVLLLTAVLSSACSVMAADNNRVVYETEIDADIDAVWSAFTTNQGLRAWMAPLVEIELALGGKIKANYNAKGKLGDETTIENTILSFDPKRMLSLKATGFPKGFPFEDAAKATWSVFYFTELPSSRTKVTVVGLGYTDDEQSKKMRSFFATANKHSLDKLKEALKSSDRPQEKARPAESTASSSAEELAAIAWVKSVDGRIQRVKNRTNPRKKRQRGPIESVGLGRGAGSDPDAIRVTDKGLKHLAAFPQLRQLDLGTSSEVTSDGIKGLSELPMLIDLSYTPENKDCVQALSHLTNLQRLTLLQARVTDSDLPSLSRLPLRKLCLSYTSVSDDGLKHLVPLSKLDALHLEKTSVSDAGLKQLATMESLRNLNLSKTKITKSGLKELTRLKKLQVLYLACLGIGDAEVELLSAFGGLEKLSLHNNPVTDAGMKSVGRLKELRRLSLVSTKVTDEGLQSLAACSKLEMVDLYNTKVTREGIATLKKALPNCIVTISFSYGGIPDVKITRTKSGVKLEAPEDAWP